MTARYTQGRLTVHKTAVVYHSHGEGRMRIAATISRYLLGLMFTVFGLNGFLQFLPAPPMVGLPAQFFAVMTSSHYMVPVFLVQVVSGLLFLAGLYVPLALTLIAPVIVNILIYHVTMNPAGIVPGLVAAICWAIVFASVRSAFAGIFQRRVM